jgi:hypothetical protein
MSDWGENVKVNIRVGHKGQKNRGAETINKAG